MGIFGVLLFVLWSILVLRYYRSIQSVANYACGNDVSVFGAIYKNTYHLMADISFLENLWSGEKIGSEEDQELRQRLIRARKLLRFNMFFSLGLFFGFLAIIVSTT
jgi:hypothetical protein